MLHKQNSKLLVLLCVLFFGGFTSTILAQGDTWATKTPMPKARAMASACEVNGIIYVIGGITPDAWPYAVSTVEAYDPATDTWTVKTSMPTARHSLATCSLNGKIYAIGGSNDPTSQGGTIATVEEYDPMTDNWQSKKDMPTARVYLAACSLEGKIYAIGGMLNNQAQSAVEVYDPTTDTWSPKKSMLTARNYLAGCSADGKIYAIGGAIGYSSDELPHNEAYDPATDSWSAQNNMPTARLGLSASPVNGKAYAIGGSKNFYDHGLKIFEEYDPAIDYWTSRAEMPTPRVWHTSCSVNGKIYVIGGTTDGYPSGAVATVEEYTPLMTNISNYALDQTIPKEFKLYQNCPNPFNPQTMIEYELPFTSEVTITVYDILGHEIRRLIQETKSTGIHSVLWDGRNDFGRPVASGMYFYRIEVKAHEVEQQSFVDVKRMVLMK